MSAHSPFSLRPNPEDALHFLGVWFAGFDPLSLISLTMMSAATQRAQVLTETISNITSAIEGDGLDPLVWPGEGGEHNLYTGLCSLTERPKPGRRGGLKLVDQVGGAWLDLDVKETAFEGEEQVMPLVESLPLRPTMVVLTGSGGAHAYWKFHQPVNGDKARELVERWYLLAQRHAGDVKIDKLVNPDRILRLPGSIRWPKSTDPADAEPTLCRIFESTGETHDPIAMLDLTQSAWRDHQAHVESTRARVQEGEREARQGAAGALEGVGRWGRMAMLAKVDEIFNERFTWESVLEPHGWTMLETDYDGRVGWSRPGDGVKRGATTDWPESPHVMSLFSTSPETGLLDLLEAGVPLTKYRVWVELACGGDEALAVRTMMEHLEGEGTA